MSPNSKMPYDRRIENPTLKGKARRDNTGIEAISRIKMLLAAGAVAGTLGGWALVAQQDASTAAQADAAQTNAAALVSASPTPTLTPQATATAQPAAQAAVSQTTDTPTVEPTATTAEA